MVWQKLLPGKISMMDRSPVSGKSFLLGKILEQAKHEIRCGWGGKNIYIYIYILTGDCRR